jgi:pyruvate formate lyase activating enzyme
MMVDEMLVDRLSDSRIRCRVCRWQCVINPGQTGVCRVRRNRDGQPELLSYAEVSSVAVDPVEKKPLYHFFPGSKVLSLGSWGCNFRCRHCQNWEIACVERIQGSRRISPAEAVELAHRQHCSGMAWTYNEPSVWFEYTLDSARLARQNQLYTAYVTNGFLSEDALDLIGPWLDAWRVDIKGFSDQFYSFIAKIRSWRGILETTKRALFKWGMHVEVVTNIIPTLNDDDIQLRGIANWIHDELGPLTPWHITRFQPEFRLSNLPPTPISTLERAAMIGHETGLHFVYIGNVPSKEDNTNCYKCGALIISRQGYRVTVNNIVGSKCERCGSDLNLRLRTGPTAGQTPIDEE